MKMKTKEVDTSGKRKSWAIPGEAVSIEEFKRGIKEAEKGPFYTIEESKAMMGGWRKKRNSAKVSSKNLI
jgi:predicted transcriptional regulator